MKCTGTPCSFMVAVLQSTVTAEPPWIPVRLLILHLPCVTVTPFSFVFQGTLTEGSQISLMPTGQVSKVDSIYINEER